MLPRDHETVEEYQKRLQEKEKHFQEMGYRRLTDIVDGKLIKELYGFSPKGIWCFFSSSRLPFWYAAMTWIMDDGTSVIQFQKRFAIKSSFLGYSLEEVAAHEALHAFRAGFSGDRFEEIFAYQSSKKWLRHHLGPLFRAPWESWAFFVTLLPPYFGLLGYFFPFAFLAWRFARLHQDRGLFQKALKTLKKIFPGAVNPLALLVRMNEQEILLFSRGNVESYVKKQTSLRWQQIREIGMGRP